MQLINKSFNFLFFWKCLLLYKDLTLMLVWPPLTTPLPKLSSHSLEPKDSNILWNQCTLIPLFNFTRFSNQNISYNIPCSLSTRAASLGYGVRTSFISKSNTLNLTELGDCPAPTTYIQKSDFDKSSPYARAFSFGISRDAYSKVYIKENPPSDKSIPGPGQY